MNFDCPSCYVNQAIEISGYAEMTKETRWEGVKSVCDELSNLDRKSPFSKVDRSVQKSTTTILNQVIPIEERKTIATNRLVDFPTILRKKVENSPDPKNRDYASSRG